MIIRRIVLICCVSFIAAGILVGCTRNRPTPEPVATTEADTGITVITTTGGLDPVVTVAQAGAEATPVAAAQTPTPTALQPKTIDYHVQEGDTLLSVAQKFQVELETVRQLNYLLTDDIFVGQILQMPYREGITAEGAPTPTPEPYFYTVEAGDSLSTIAQQFGVSTVAIMETNNLQDANSIYIGQSLEIPGYAVASASTSASSDGSVGATGTSGTSSTGAGGVAHIVQPGETLYGIAQKYDVEANAITDANNIVNRNQLRVGQKLVIPGITAQEAARATGRLHTVQSGESLTGIAQSYGVSAEDISTLNNISDPDTIFVGQELLIPGP